MNPEEQLLEPSKIRSLLIKAQIALKENRYEEALSIIQEINAEDMAGLSSEELQAVGRVLAYLKELSEEKKQFLVEELKKIQAAKQYLG
ncbi:MAG: hypothetical protein ACPLZA_03900 [Thermodesulfovibrio sp.]|jgi:hypothetical protein|uniref:Tetratricopeptide repeat protein n=2 Tax=Thermodesulfovibrio TaxID=28261 RepID=A0A2J6WN38_9BACT|nr:MAG: hypothetical protein C0186_02775 [Thermodesulfovibrio aggregans]